MPYASGGQLAFGNSMDEDYEDTSESATDKGRQFDAPDYFVSGGYWTDDEYEDQVRPTVVAEDAEDDAEDQVCEDLHDSGVGPGNRESDFMQKLFF